MSLIECPECKKKISDQYGKCPDCGYQIETAKEPAAKTEDEVAEKEIVVEESANKPEKEEKTNKKLLIGIILVALILIVAVALLVLPHFKGNANGGNNTSTPSSDQASSNQNQEQTKSQKELAIEAANKYRNDNKDTILSIGELYNHLSTLGYSDEICEELCYTEKIDGFYDGARAYDYEKIALFHSWGYSREAIIKYYNGFVSQEEIEYLVDECLAGRKLTYQYVNDQFQLVEHN